jgi:hypothetical protein
MARVFTVGAVVGVSQVTNEANNGIRYQTLPIVEISLLMASARSKLYFSSSVTASYDVKCIRVNNYQEILQFYCHSMLRTAALAVFVQ